MFSYPRCLKFELVIHLSQTSMDMTKRMWQRRHYDATSYHKYLRHSWDQNGTCQTVNDISQPGLDTIIRHYTVRYKIKVELYFIYIIEFILLAIEMQKSSPITSKIRLFSIKLKYNVKINYSFQLSITNSINIAENLFFNNSYV